MAVLGVLCKSSRYAKNPLWLLAAHLHRSLVQAPRPALTSRFCITSWLGQATLSHCNSSCNVTGQPFIDQLLLLLGCRARQFENITVHYQTDLSLRFVPHPALHYAHNAGKSSGYLANGDNQ